MSRLLTTKNYWCVIIDIVHYFMAINLRTKFILVNRFGNSIYLYLFYMSRSLACSGKSRSCAYFFSPLVAHVLILRQHALCCLASFGQCTRVPVDGQYHHHVLLRRGPREGDQEEAVHGPRELRVRLPAGLLPQRSVPDLRRRPGQAECMGLGVDKGKLISHFVNLQA